MKLKVAKSDLEAALKVVSVSVANSATDASSHYLFTQDGDQVQLRSFSNRVFSSTPLTGCMVEGDFKPFTVEAKRLKIWLSAVEDSALTFELEGALVVATGLKGKGQFQSLNPNSFPRWDKFFKEVKLVGSVPADKLRASLAYAKNFVSDQESQNPNICVVALNAGEVLSTDSIGLSRTYIEHLKEVDVKIHGRDVPSLLSFLGLFETNFVEILEHDRFTIFKGHEGSLWGEACPTAKFPKMDQSLIESDVWWEIPKDELKKAIKILSASASWEDHKLYLSREGDVVKARMNSFSGGDVVYEIPCIDHTTDEVPEFSVSYKYLEKILSPHEEDVVKVGIKKRSNTGLIFVKDTRLGDEYSTVLCWMS